MTTAVGKRIGSVRLDGLLYVEESRSPKVLVARSYDETDVGHLRKTTVTRTLLTEKAILPLVLAAIESEPAPLMTDGGLKSDGTPEDDINWGCGFELESIDSQSWENSPSLVQLLVVYNRTRADAIEHPPTGMEIVCSDGNCTIYWREALMVQYASGLSACSTGLTAVRSGSRLQFFCNDVLVAEWENSDGAESGTGFEWAVSADGYSVSLVWDGTVMFTWQNP